MASRSIVLSLTLLLCFVALFAQCQSQTWNSVNLDTNKNFVRPLGSIAFGLPGAITIQVATPYTMWVCLSEYVIIVGNIQTCNPQNLFQLSVNTSSQSINKNGKMISLKSDKNFDFDSDTLQAANGFGFDVSDNSQKTIYMADVVPQVFGIQTTVAGGSAYYAIFAFDPSIPVKNATFSFLITIPDGPLCPVGSVGLINGFCTPTTPLANSLPTEFNLKTNLSNYFSVIVPQNVYNEVLNITIQLSTSTTLDAQDNGNQSFVAQLRRGNAPNSHDYDLSSESNSINDTLVLSVDTPQPGEYVLLLQSTFSFVVAANVSVEVSSCNSSLNLVGKSCEDTFEDITSQTGVKEFEGTGDYQYYIVRNNSNIIVGVSTEDVEDIAPSLYVSYLNFPTSTSAMLIAENGTTNFIYSVGTVGTNSTTWYISVLAEEDQDYYLWIDTPCPNNCEGDDFDGTATTEMYGSCNFYTGVCTCNDDYEELTCTPSGLSTVAIVLIAIACAIVVAVIIIVPIFIYLRNRQRTRYERV